MASTAFVVDGYKETLRAIRAFDPALRRELNRELRQEAAGVLIAARVNSAWSERIPSALALSVTAKDVAVRVKRARAPHGPLFERGGRGNSGTFRHPVFGNRNVWVAQNRRPFIQPAVDARRNQVVAGVAAAVQTAARKAGL
jgi:hypothetical protein